MIMSIYNPYINYFSQCFALEAQLKVFLRFYFEIIVDLHAVVRSDTEIPNMLPPVSVSWILL